jgi:hypothetical protein
VPPHLVRAPLVLAVAALATGLTASPAPAGELPTRTVETTVVLNAKNQLVMRGDVTPGLAGLVVVVQRKDCRKSTCAWRAWERLEATSQGRFRSRIEAPRHGSDYYRARVPQHHGYATSYSRVWRTWTD